MLLMAMTDIGVKPHEQCTASLSFAHHSLDGLRGCLSLVHQVLCGKVDARAFLQRTNLGISFTKRYLNRGVTVCSGWLTGVRNSAGSTLPQSSTYLTVFIEPIPLRPTLKERENIHQDGIPFSHTSLRRRRVPVRFFSGREIYQAFWEHRKRTTNMLVRFIRFQLFVAH